MAYQGNTGYYSGNRQEPDEEITQIEAKIDKTTNDSLASTRRIKQIANETEHVGADSLYALHGQGEQLDNIEDNLDDIDASLKRTGKELNGMEKFWGMFKLPGSGVKKYEKSKAYKQAYSNKALKEEMKSHQRTESEATSSKSMSNPQKGPIINRVTNDVREDEMESNLSDVSKMLDNMKGIATDMGEELERQNHQLGRIQKKAHANEEHLRVANYRVHKQL